MTDINNTRSRIHLFIYLYSKTICMGNIRLAHLTPLEIEMGKSQVGYAFVCSSFYLLFQVS